MSIIDEAKKIKDLLNEESQVSVRIALFGRSGVGKSSIINKLLGEYRATTGEGEDITKERDDHEWNGLILSDLPGYNTENFPDDTYFRRFGILEDFDLFICVFTNRIYESDLEFFNKLRDYGKPCIFVRNRVDDIWDEQKTIEELKADIVEATLKQLKSYKEDIIFTSCRLNEGFDLLSEKILSYLGEAKKKRYYASAKAYSRDFLDKKHDIAKNKVTYYAALSAANGLNPIPGADLTVDIGVLVTLFAQIRSIYGLSITDKAVENYKNVLSPSLIQVLNSVIKYSTKQGVLFLLEKFASKEVARRFARYIPFVGTIVAGTTGYMITKSAGDSYVDDCHKLALEIFRLDLA